MLNAMLNDTSDCYECSLVSMRGIGKYFFKIKYQQQIFSVFDRIISAVTGDELSLDGVKTAALCLASGEVLCKESSDIHIPASTHSIVEPRTQEARGVLSWPIEEDLLSFDDLSPTEEAVDGRLKRSLNGAAVIEEDRATSICESSSSLRSDDLGRIAIRALK